jgi:cytochrome c biogenesis factor
MRLKYETGTATLIQFIVLGLLNIADALQSIITTCTHSGGDCVGNLLSSIIFYFLIIIWFGIILMIGFGAQHARSKRLARVLVCAELAVIVVAAYNIKLDLKYHNGYLSLITSFVDVVLSAWVIYLTFHLLKASGRRVMKRQRRTKNSKP